MNKWFSNIIFPIIALIFLFLSCDKDYFTSCSDCSVTEPVEVNIHVKLDPENRPEEISVYEGNLEDSLILKVYKNPSALGLIDVSVYKNKKYTLTASYRYTNDLLYLAIDSSTPRVQLERERCTDPCYYVIDNLVDLRIRYTK